MKDIIQSNRMLYIALIIFVFLFIYYVSHNSDGHKNFEWFLRVITSLAAGSMSMSLSGSINIGKGDDIKTLAEESPRFTAAGALAVFLIVYLFEAGSIG